MSHTQIRRLTLTLWAILFQMLALSFFLPGTIPRRPSNTASGNPLWPKEVTDFTCAGLVLVAGVLIFRAVRLREPQRGYCRDCGYHLRGHMTSRCPECGRQIRVRRTMDGFARIHAGKPSNACSDSPNPL